MKETETKKLSIYLTVYASFFDTHAQLPILALFASSIGADPFWIGAVIGIYSIFNIIGNGIGGMAIDRLGWRKPLLLGLVLVTMALFGYQLVGSTSVLLLVRAYHGLAGGILIPATLASLSPMSGKDFKTEHSRNVSLYGVSIGMAALTGPPFASIVSSMQGFKAAYLGIALLMTTATVFSFLFTKDRETTFVAGAFRDQRSFNFRIPPVSRIACLLAFAMMGGTGTLAAFLPILARDIGFSQAGIGMLFGLFAFAVVLLQLWRAASGWVPARLFKTAQMGILVLAGSLILIHFANSKILFTAAVLLYGTGFGLVFPNILSLVIKGTSLENKGIITGIFFAFYSLGAALIPPMGGYAWQLFPGFSPPLTAAVVMAITLLWVNRYRKTIAAVESGIEEIH